MSYNVDLIMSQSLSEARRNEMESDDDGIGPSFGFIYLVCS